MMRSFIAGMVAVGVLAPAATAQISVQIPDKYKYECRLDRTVLTTTTIAANPEIYPRFVSRVDGGWLVFDEFLKEVIELDDALREVRRWGREGEGPLEYENPIALMRLPSGEVVVVDGSPPSIMVLGGEGQSEHQLNGIDPEAAVLQEDGNILLAGKYGNLYVVAPDGKILRKVISPGDIGLPPEPTEGSYPELLVRPPFIGLVGPSTIWTLQGKGRPRKVLQRCVHKDLERIHERAPTIVLPQIGRVPYTVVTMLDFLPTPGGILTFGGLKVNAEQDRSIELYDDESGKLTGAWRLTGYPGAKGAFDPHNPQRILLWNKENLDGLLLVEVDGEGFPSIP